MGVILDVPNGKTRFAPGERVGVILDVPNGKNDGEVLGIKYFNCRPNKAWAICT